MPTMQALLELPIVPDSVTLIPDDSFDADIYFRHFSRLALTEWIAFSLYNADPVPEHWEVKPFINSDKNIAAFSAFHLIDESRVFFGRLSVQGSSLSSVLVEQNYPTLQYQGRKSNSFQSVFKSSTVFQEDTVINPEDYHWLLFTQDGKGKVTGNLKQFKAFSALFSFPGWIGVPLLSSSNYQV